MKWIAIIKAKMGGLSNEAEMIGGERVLKKKAILIRWRFFLFRCRRRFIKEKGYWAYTLFYITLIACAPSCCDAIAFVVP